VSVGARSHLALLEVLTEGVGGGVEHARAALELAERRGWSAIPQTACAHLTLAISAFFDLKPDEAAEHLTRAKAVASSTPGRQLHFMLVHLDVRMQLTRGRPEEGLRALDRYEVAFRTGMPPPYERAAAIALRARLLATAGDLEGARARVAELATEPWLVADVAVARMLLADGEPAAAAERLAAAAEVHERELHTVTGMELAVLQALLTRQIRHGTAHRAVVGELLDAFADRAPARHSVAPLLEPLSDREQAILRYLPTTLSNREIAAELFVTTNTVKTHLRSIYRKLDVARRREAVERARDLRLLSGGASRR
jgi:LuxR family maltose regulon positive regulatory protein